MGRREANGKCNELVSAHLSEDSHKKMIKATRNERSFSKYKAGSHPGTSCIIKSQHFTILMTLRYHENWADLPHCSDLFNLSGERRGGWVAPQTLMSQFATGKYQKVPRPSDAHTYKNKNKQFIFFSNLFTSWSPRGGCLALRSRTWFASWRYREDRLEINK